MLEPVIVALHKDPYHRRPQTSLMSPKFQSKFLNVSKGAVRDPLMSLKSGSKISVVSKSVIKDR